MTGFIETPRFPDEIAYWAIGGRNFLTTVVQTYGGNEYRNAAWDRALGMWDIQDALRSQNPASAYAYTALRNMWMVVRGQLNGFRFKDFRDFKDEGAGVLGTTGLAVASTTVYQMYKNYAVSPLAYQGIVQKPVVGATEIYNNGVLQLLTTNYTIDESTGLVTFTSQPTVGHTLTWKGTYDIPCRFAVDGQQAGPDNAGALLDWQSVKIVELRNWT